MAPAVKVGTIHWRGDGDVTYPYAIYDIRVTLPDVPGNYVWAKRIPETGKYLPIYAGEAESLGRRVTPGHERYACAINAGATHITFHAHPTNSVGARLAEETAIRNRYNPHCNRQ